MKGKMSANVFYEKERMEFTELPIPVPGENEVLIRVRACGICGSDVAYYYGRSPLETRDGKGPLIIGHEISGEVAEVGKEAERKGFFKAGDRVTVNPPQPCHVCTYCRRTKVNLCENTKTVGVSVNGGFAEYVKVNYTNVFRLPDGVGYEEGAMAEPLACACYGVKNLEVKTGDTVVVIGAGAIGLMMAQLIRIKGAGKVIVTAARDYPLRKALEVGADVVFNTVDPSSGYYTSDLGQSVAELNHGMGADKVIVATAAPRAFNDAFRVSAKGSTIVFFGLPGEKDIIEVPALETLTGDKTLRFSWLAPFTWDEAVKVLASGRLKLKPLITHTFPLEGTVDGIRFMNSGEKEKIKGMIVL